MADNHENKKPQEDPGGHKGSKEVKVSVRLGDDNSTKVHFAADSEDTLLDVRTTSANELGVTLLPTPEDSFDVLREEDGEEALDLSQTLGDFLDQHGHKPKFQLDLALAIKVNAIWKVAPEASMTPRQILALFGLAVEEYTLYKPESAEPLPVDSPLTLTRGDCFEAQKDGKYGDR